MQTEQLGRIVNELDTIQFSIKKATQMVREIGKQVCLYVYQHALNSLAVANTYLTLHTFFWVVFEKESHLD